MKKRLVALILALAFVLGACSTGTTPSTEGEKKESNEPTKLVIGVSPVPHEELTKIAQKILKDEGIELEIKVFDDYVLPNEALADGSLDANFFQHEPYMKTFEQEKGQDFANIGGVHVEPIALYSTKIKSLDELKDGAEILIPADSSNGSRALFLLETNGLIKLKEGVGDLVTEQDIVENPKNVKFTPVDAAILTKSYADVDAAVINSNFAIQAGLNPLKDGIVIEGTESKYANIIAVREADKDKEVFQKLIKAFQSEEVKKFIEDTYKGSVVPAF